MRQTKKIKKINGFKIWLEKKLGLRCPECSGKSSFHHYKRCSHYRKDEKPEEITVTNWLGKGICNDCKDIEKFKNKECEPTTFNTCKEFKQILPQ